jgi:hypothetical protein
LKARGNLLIPLLVVFLLALTIRLYPLAFSPYPYNIDGLGEAMLSDGIYRTGGLATPPDAGYEGSYIVQMPLMDALAAAVATFVGTEPLLLLQPLTAVIGAISCVVAALAVHMITGNRRISVISGMFLALLGTYVMCTSSAWKETLGLAMMLLIMGLYLKRGDIRFRLLMTAALVMMVFVHHHSAVLTFLIITFAVACECNKALRGKKWRWGNNADILTMASVWVLALAYYSAIDLPYYRFLRPDTDLYLFIAVACAMALLMFTSMAGKWIGARRHYLKMSIPAVAVGLIVLNFFNPLFPGIPGTESTLLLFVLSYLLLVLPMWFGSERTFIPGQGPTPLLLAALFAPLSMILFGFLRALDPTSHMVIYRTFDFLDFGLALLFGAGLIVMVRNMRKWAPVVVTVFLLILATTTPIAFQTEGLFGVQNYTYGYEIDSFRIIHSISTAEIVDSDQRISTSIGWFYDLSCSPDLAYDIEMGEALPEGHWLLVESSWTTSGAQEFPLEPRVIDEAAFSEFLDGQNVLLIAGPSENQLIAAKVPY